MNLDETKTYELIVIGKNEALVGFLNAGNPACDIIVVADPAWCIYKIACHSCTWRSKEGEQSKPLSAERKEQLEQIAQTEHLRGVAESVQDIFSGIKPEKLGGVFIGGTCPEFKANLSLEIQEKVLGDFSMMETGNAGLTALCKLAMAMKR